MLVVNIQEDAKTLLILLGIIGVEAVVIMHQFLQCFALG